MEFEYRSNPWLLLLGAIIFGGASVALWSAAQSKPDVIDILTAKFYGSHAVVILYVLCASSVLLSVSGVFGFAASLTMTGNLVLSEVGITMPKTPLRKALNSVLFADITALKKQNIMGKDMLEITTVTGKITIARQCLRPKTAYTEVVDYIYAHSPVS